MKEKLDEDVLVSVIVPVYNVQDYIDRCVQSLVNQSYTNIEIIIVDDGSTDQCTMKCETYAKSDNRIRIYHQENQGQAVARNQGIEMAQGDFLCFVDSDDYVSEYFIEHLLYLLKKYKTKIAYCSMKHIGFPNRANEEEESGQSLFTGMEAAYNTLVGSHGFTAAACRGIYSKDLFKATRFMRGRLYEDLELVVRLNLSVESCVISKSRLYFYCYRSNNSSSTPLEKKVLDFFAVMNSVYKVIDKEVDLLKAAQGRDMMNCLFILEGAIKQGVKDKEYPVKLRERIIALPDGYAFQTPLYKAYYLSLRIGIAPFKVTCSILNIVRTVLIKLGL